MDDFSTLVSVSLYKSFPIGKFEDFFKNLLKQLIINYAMYSDFARVSNLTGDSVLLDSLFFSLLQCKKQVSSLEIFEYFGLSCDLDEAKRLLENLGECFPNLKKFKTQLYLEDKPPFEFIGDCILSFNSSILSACPHLVRLDLDMIDTFEYSNIRTAVASEKAILSFMDALDSHQALQEMYFKGEPLNISDDFRLFGDSKEAIISSLKQKN